MDMVQLLDVINNDLNVTPDMCPITPLLTPEKNVLEYKDKRSEVTEKTL
jgi:hypothetical protein